LRGLVRNDVDALYRHLIDPVRGGYRPEDVTVLVNKELDGKTLAKVFEAAPGLDKETEVLVYFSGHGDRQEGNYSCLVSFDGCERLDTILAPFRDAKPGWMTVILDACFAGDPKIPRNFNWGTGERNILAAATEKTTAFMTDGRSLVTSTLLEFLTNDALAQEIDVVRSGRIRAGDLFHAVETTLENYRFQKQDVLQDVWSMGAGGKQTLAWRPPTHVARHILDRIDVESMSLGERQFLKTLIQVVTTPGTSQVKSMVIDLLRDLAHRHIKTEPEAWALLRAMEPFLRRLDPAAFSSDAR
jgi:hypothetical protein